MNIQFITGRESHVDVRGRGISERKMKQWTEVGECLRVFC